MSIGRDKLDSLACRLPIDESLSVLIHPFSPSCSGVVWLAFISWQQSHVEKNVKNNIIFCLSNNGGKSSDREEKKAE